MLGHVSLGPHGLYSPWNSPGQNTGVGSFSLLQRTFPNQGLNPGLLHCKQILYQLSHKGNPRILQWVTYLFSSRYSQPRNWTRVSCIAGRFFNNWTTREIYIFYLKETWLFQKYQCVISIVVFILKSKNISSSCTLYACMILSYFLYLSNSKTPNSILKYHMISLKYGI